MSGFVIHSAYQVGYLEFVPVDGSVMWACELADAHVFSMTDAVAVVDKLPDGWDCRVVRDYHEREAEPVPRRVQWPDEIEPPEADGEAFRGGEAAAYEREQQAECQRLK